MSSGVYDVFKEDLADGSVNLSSAGDTLKIALYDSNHVFNASDTVFTSTNEVSGTGYTAGGETITGQVLTVASNTVTFNADDVPWTSADFSAFHAVLYDTTNTSSLILSIDFGEAKTPSGSDEFTIIWNSNGIITLA